MLNNVDLLNTFKKVALEAVNTSQPSDFCFGKVTSAKPLKILVEQKMTLGTAQLVLPKNLTDYTVPVTLGWNTELYEGHKHQIQGSKTITIHNALQVGDEVILLKKKGGQKYLVLDRAVKT